MAMPGTYWEIMWGERKPLEGDVAAAGSEEEGMGDDAHGQVMVVSSLPC